VFSSFDKTFQVDLPNGEYRVHIIVGDQLYMHDRIDVYAENSLAVNDLTVRAGLFVEEYFTVVVKDGQLNLKFHDDGGTDPNWVINALTIDV
jgi:fibronectin type 3 domain-containing protein